MRDLDLARTLHDVVRDHPDFEVLDEPGPASYCFRYLPNVLAGQIDAPGVGELVDQLNQHIAEELKDCVLALLDTTRIRGRVSLRLSIGAHGLTPADVDATFEAIAGAGKRRWASTRLQDMGSEKEMES